MEMCVRLAGGHARRIRPRRNKSSPRRNTIAADRPIASADFLPPSTGLVSVVRATSVAIAPQDAMAPA